ncbi:hypothetical protein FH972_020813 [Carpinus fangiana]|uniref:Fe2OG dioxygenase domain-containing protein n=1 Tax=Carpinus fangiana TaxID=176857 RepID=A0A5N6RXT5_9ROSI|nr:hypothetical protein FH972_020813 [Carpinus fangiana]
MAEGGNLKCIPVIDMQEMEDVKQYKKLREASEEWGCFRIVNHNIPASLMSEMKKVVKELLDLPMEIKKRNTDVIAGSGYVAPSSSNPLYEALGLYDLGSPEAVRAFCSQLDASPQQREIIEAYAEAIHELGIDLGRKLAKRSSGVQIHTDSGFLTILQDDENVGGLEVMDKSGAFVAVHPCAGTLLVNLGDVAKAWSNGRFCNVKHRVQCKEATIRVSIASFVLGPKEAAVEAPPQLVDSQHPRLYAPFTYEDYRKLYISSKFKAGEALQHVRTHYS